MQCRSNLFLKLAITLWILYLVIFPFVFICKVNCNDYIQTSSQEEKLTVIIDAGHGGEDCGAIGKNNVYEKELNMQISLKLGDYLSAAGYTVVYTRTEDKLLYSDDENIKGMRKIYDLKNRIEIANAYENAIFISIHMNSYGYENCKGLQVYHSSNNNSSALAQAVQDSVCTKVQPTNKRTIKNGNDLYVLQHSLNPAILIECGFVSNAEECKKLCEKEYQKELSFAILCGIIEYEKKNNRL